MLSSALRDTPRPLILAAVLFFGAAYFTVRFPEAPGASAGSYAATLLIALPSVVALFSYLGTRRALFSLTALATFGYAIETTGVATGFPYGTFYYGDALGPKALGLVPYLLPVSYVPLVVGAVAASAGARSPSSGGLALWALRSAVLLVLIDGVLDPGAASLGFWVWPDGGAYYGVPVSNYLGWVLSSVLAAALLLALGRWKETPLPGLVDSAVIAVAFWAGVAVFSGLLLPAILGGLLFVYLIRHRSRLRQAARSGYKLRLDEQEDQDGA